MKKLKKHRKLKKYRMCKLCKKKVGRVGYTGVVDKNNKLSFYHNECYLKMRQDEENVKN